MKYTYTISGEVEADSISEATSKASGGDGATKLDVKESAGPNTVGFTK